MVFRPLCIIYDQRPIMTTELLSYSCRHRHMCPGPSGRTCFPTEGNMVSRQPQLAGSLEPASPTWSSGVTPTQGQPTSNERVLWGYTGLSISARHGTVLKAVYVPELPARLGLPHGFISLPQCYFFLSFTVLISNKPVDY